MPFPTKSISPGEYALIAVLHRIVIEAMDYPPVRPYDMDSHLPANLIEDAQRVLNEYGVRVLSGEPPQALGISSPVVGRVGGNTPIVVEVYALGRGVALEGQGSDLLGREGAFELKANGKVFVFDPLGARHANGLVTPVERHVTTLLQPLEAVDHEHLTELGNSLGHIKPLKAAILSLPAGSGKSAIAGLLSQRLGCTSVVDEWNTDKPLTPGALHLTNDLIWIGGAA